MNEMTGIFFSPLTLGGRDLNECLVVMKMKAYAFHNSHSAMWCNEQSG